MNASHEFTYAVLVFFFFLQNAYFQRPQNSGIEARNDSGIDEANEEFTPEEIGACEGDRCDPPMALLYLSCFPDLRFRTDVAVFWRGRKGMSD